MGEKTDIPESRRDNFLFNDPSSTQTTHRAYLLYYSGIHPSGSQIPFEVGISNAFEKVIVTIVDLNPPAGQGYVQRRWEVTKK